MSKKEQEKRYLAVKIEQAAEARTSFKGCAAKYDTDSQYMGFIERLAPGCFEKTLQENRNIRATFNHDQDAILGTVAAGTLRLENRGDGLYFEADIPDTTAGRDTLALVERGDVQGCSFIFYVIKDEWREDPQGIPYRTVLEAKLVEISLVIDPAYLATEVEARNMPEELQKAAENRTTLGAGQPPEPDYLTALLSVELELMALEL